MAIFRKAKKADFNKIIDLYNSARNTGKMNGTCAWDEDYPNIDILEDDLKNNNIYALEDNGKLISVITMIENVEIDISPHKWRYTDSCFLVRLCVDPEYQGKGIGEIMMINIGKEAKEIGYKGTHHLAAVSNRAANRLYERMGYENKGNTKLEDEEYYAYEIEL
jgi:ribosomal protein S18 acetylase RimI-like enzyme